MASNLRKLVSPPPPRSAQALISGTSWRFLHEEPSLLLPLSWLSLSLFTQPIFTMHWATTVARPGAILFQVRVEWQTEARREGKLPREKPGKASRRLSRVSLLRVGGCERSSLGDLCVSQSVSP